MDTLDVMAALVDQGIDVPSVVDAARTLAVAAGSRDETRQALTIRSWLARVWRFVADPLDRELLRSPSVLLNEYFRTGRVAGDCDEAAILGAALGRAIGLGATFTVLAFADPATGASTPNDPFGHVFASLLTADGQAIDLDVTRPSGPVPPATRFLTVDV